MTGNHVCLASGGLFGRVLISTASTFCLGSSSPGGSLRFGQAITEGCPLGFAVLPTNSGSLGQCGRTIGRAIRIGQGPTGGFGGFREAGSQGLGTLRKAAQSSGHGGIQGEGAGCLGLRLGSGEFLGQGLAGGCQGRFRFGQSLLGSKVSIGLGLESGQGRLGFGSEGGRRGGALANTVATGCRIQGALGLGTSRFIAAGRPGQIRQIRQPLGGTITTTGSFAFGGQSGLGQIITTAGFLRVPLADDRYRILRQFIEQLGVEGRGRLSSICRGSRTGRFPGQGKFLGQVLQGSGLVGIPLPFGLQLHGHLGRIGCAL